MDKILSSAKMVVLNYHLSWFSVPADMDEVMSLKTQLDRWEVPDEITDAHTPASLLKLWYRELYEPLIPDSMYEQCVTYHDDPHHVLSLIDQLPDINRLVLAYLISFLQVSCIHLHQARA